MAFPSSVREEGEGVIKRFRTEVVVGVAPTERMSGLEGEAEWIAWEVTRRASNSWRR